LVFGLHSNSRIEWFVDWDICSCYADVHAILGEENCSWNEIYAAPNDISCRKFRSVVASFAARGKKAAVITYKFLSWNNLNQ
jgi:hypothetical protein